MGTKNADIKSNILDTAQDYVAPETSEKRICSTLSRNRLLFPIASLFLIFSLLSVCTVVLYVIPQSYQVIMLCQVALLIVGLGLIIHVVYRIRQQLLKPLDGLREWSKQIRSGDLESHIIVPAKGEFATLIQDINSLTDELHSLTDEMDARVQNQTEHIADKSRSLEILYDIATSLSSAQNLDELLKQFLDTLMTLVDARAASVRLLDSQNMTRLVASRGFSEVIKEQEKLVDIDRCLCGKITRHGGIGIQKGIEACNQFLSCSIIKGDCKEMLVIPLQYQERILGVYNIFLDRPSRELGKDIRDLLNSIGKHLGLAIEKTRLDQNARRLAIMEERNMIANELHDSLAQSLVSMRLQTKMMGETLYKKDIRHAQNEVRSLNTAIDDAHKSLRELLSNFRSKMDERGLVYAVNDLLYTFKQETNINTYIHCNDSKEHSGLSPAQEFQVYRIIQESLVNVKKHSDACNVRVLINRLPKDGCNVLIEDDGQGIEEPESNTEPGEHIGLSVMKERADAIDGELLIESEPGEGTRVLLHVPASSHI